MINFTRTIIIIAICASITLIERALPFLIFKNGDVPDYIDYLGKVLGPVIMVTLLIYCIRNISFQQFSGFLPQLVSLIITVFLHIWKKIQWFLL